MKCLPWLLMMLVLLPASIQAQEGDPLLFLRQTEAYHHTTAWKKQAAAEAQITVEFQERPLFAGQLLMRPNAARIRLTRDDGAVVVFDGATAWLLPAGADWERARFDALRWAYLWALPHKLEDHGARLESIGQKRLQGEPYDVARLTFDPGTGDSPDDTIEVYQNPETGQLKAAVLVAGRGREDADAVAEPIAIVYDQFQGVNDITVPHRWRFYRWSNESGLLGEPIGMVTLRDVVFPEPDATKFAAPEGARKLEKPSPHP